MWGGYRYSKYSATCFLLLYSSATVPVPCTVRTVVLRYFERGLLVSRLEACGVNASDVKKLREGGFHTVESVMKHNDASLFSMYSLGRLFHFESFDRGKRH